MCEKLCNLTFWKKSWKNYEKIDFRINGKLFKVSRLETFSSNFHLLLFVLNSESRERIFSLLTSCYLVLRQRHTFMIIFLQYEHPHICFVSKFWTRHKKKLIYFRIKLQAKKQDELVRWSLTILLLNPLGKSIIVWFVERKTCFSKNFPFPLTLVLFVIVLARIFSSCWAYELYTVVTGRFTKNFLFMKFPCKQTFLTQI